jgi:hypothetical protein
VIIGVLTFVACWLRTFVLPGVPVLIWGDQLLYATNGARVIVGQMPYRDFFEFLPAGTDLTYAFLFRVFGLYLWIPNLVMDVLATAAVLLITIAGFKVLPGRWVALPALLAAGFGLYGGMDATHHWFSTVAALAAMVVLLLGTSVWHVAWAGALCGVMASFTQSKGTLVTLGFVVYLLWSSKQRREPARDQNQSCRTPKPPQQSRRDQLRAATLSENSTGRAYSGFVLARWLRCLLLCGSAFLTFLIVNVHYMLKLGLAEWCRWVVLFPFRYYPTVPGQTWTAPIIDFHSHSGLMKWIGASFLFAAVPITYASFLWVMASRREKEPGQPWNQLLLIAITGIAMFLSVAPSLSFIRASAVSFPAAIVLAWQLERASRTLRWARPAVATLAALCALDLVIATQRGHWYRIVLPAGQAVVREQGKYELYEWMKEHTHPGQAYFGISPLSLPLWLRCPAPIHAPGPWEYYRPEHIARSIAALESQRVPVLVLRRTPAQFENAPGYEPEHVRDLYDYIRLHYRVTKQFATGDEVWERVADDR